MANTFSLYSIPSNSLFRLVLIFNVSFWGALAAADNSSEMTYLSDSQVKLLRQANTLDDIRGLIKYTNINSRSKDRLRAPIHLLLDGSMTKLQATQRLKILDYYISCGADLDLPAGNATIPGKSPLAYALLAGDYDCALQLLEHGCNAREVYDYKSETLKPADYLSDLFASDSKAPKARKNELLKKMLTSGVALKVSSFSKWHPDAKMMQLLLMCGVEMSNGDQLRFLKSEDLGLIRTVMHFRYIHVSNETLQVAIAGLSAQPEPDFMTLDYLKGHVLVRTPEKLPLLKNALKGPKSSMIHKVVIDDIIGSHFAGLSNERMDKLFALTPHELRQSLRRLLNQYSELLSVAIRTRQVSFTLLKSYQKATKIILNR